MHWQPPQLQEQRPWWHHDQHFAPDEPNLRETSLSTPRILFALTAENRQPITRAINMILLGPIEIEQVKEKERELGQ